MEQFLHYVTTDHDARILFPVMIVLAIFGLGVIGGAAHRVARRIRLKRSQTREYEGSMQRWAQYADELRRDRPASIAAAKHGGLSYAELAERAFSHNNDAVHQDTGSFAPVQS